MPDSAIKPADTIITTGLIAAETVAQELREKLARKLSSRRMSATEAMDEARKIIDRYLPHLANAFAVTDLAAYLTGADEVMQSVQQGASRMALSVTIPHSIRDADLDYIRDAQSYRASTLNALAETYRQTDATVAALSQPPITIDVWPDGLTLRDGRHRWLMARLEGASSIKATFRELDEFGDVVNVTEKIIAVPNEGRGPLRGLFNRIFDKDGLPLPSDRFGGPPSPPGGGVTVANAADGEPPVSFPKIDEAVNSLLERNVLTREEFDLLADDAKRRAFTIAGEQSEATISRIRDIMAENINQGTSLRGFRQSLAEELESSDIGPAHLETIYRTNVQAAFQEGHDRIADDPIVGELFPYQEYIAIHDGRVRDDHLALETLGIEGTNIYRRADPFWETWSPPNGYNSIAEGEFVTTNRGSVPIENVEIGDLALTHLGNWRPVVGVHCHLGPAEIVVATTNSGRSVRLTGEHKVFTDRGWVEAASLNVGDEVYEYRQATSVNLFGAKVQQRSQVERTFDSRVPSGAGACLIPLQLNSDGQRGKVKIKPILSGALIESKRKQFADSISECFFSMRHRDNGVWMGGRRLSIASYFGSRHLTANLRAGGRRSSPQGISEFSRSLGVPLMMQPLSVGHRSSRQPFRRKQSPQRPVLCAGNAGDVSQRNFASDVEGSGVGKTAWPVFINSGFGAVPVSGGSVGLLSHKTCLHAATITSIQRQLYVGLVYDATVADDESFVVNGIAVSNCRCGTNLLTIEQAARRGLREARDWLETGNTPPLNSRLPYVPFQNEPGFARGPRRVAA